MTNYKTLLPESCGSVGIGREPRLAGLAVKRRIATYGPHVVLVDHHGRVFIRPADEPRAALMASRYPSMVAGTFNDAATSLDIAEALVFVYNEQMNGVAA
ncbi:hypothetical protein ACQKIE_16170 [Luteibacter sp. NPDC031894]|uniref:hypothetical protein n=1 Tax=Luteibacter sp. NPDC031894 TaxID=3390572 RepID=UPI003CFD29B7